MPSRADETDLSTALMALADRLRLDAAALRGIAAEANDGDTLDGRLKGALAADLDDAAARLDLLRAPLCKHCALIGVVDRLDVAAGE